MSEEVNRESIIESGAFKSPDNLVSRYDRAGDLLATHYGKNEYDVIYNPLDSHSPSCSKTFFHLTQTQVNAESYFPCKEKHLQSTSDFFTRASIAILVKLDEFSEGASI